MQNQQRVAYVVKSVSEGNASASFEGKSQMSQLSSKDQDLLICIIVNARGVRSSQTT
jgi:hypothetical protein